jgi:SAM-dependent methyltransferase
MSDHQQGWESRYQTGRTGWDRGGPSPALQYWFEHAHAPVGRVLVPGCGHGHEVAQLVRAGLQVTAVDIASQPVMRLTGELVEQGLHARVVQADLLQWQPAEPFEAIYEQTCLCAFAPGDWAAYERRLADWLVPGGCLFALFMQTGQAGGPPYDCPVADMRSLFDAARWHWLDAPALHVAHPTGLHEQGFILLRR